MRKVRAIVMGGLLLALTLVMLPVQELLVRAGRHRHAHRIPRIFHRSAVRAAGIRIHRRGEPLAPAPTLIVANHASWLDIIVLGSLVPGRFVAKAEMGGWPGIGTFTRLQRTILVDRTQRREAGRQAGAIADALDGGDTVILFPEGTTSDGNRVLPFNASLLASVRSVAERLGSVRVQPVAIAYTRRHGMPMGQRGRRHAAWIGDEDLVPHLLARLQDGALDVEVVFGDPMIVTAEANRKHLARSLEDQIRAMFMDALHGARSPRGG